MFWRIINIKIMREGGFPPFWGRKPLIMNILALYQVVWWCIFLTSKSRQPPESYRWSSSLSMRTCASHLRARQDRWITQSSRSASRPKSSAINVERDDPNTEIRTTKVVLIRFQRLNMSTKILKRHFQMTELLKLTVSVTYCQVSQNLLKKVKCLLLFSPCKNVERFQYPVKDF